MKFGDYCEGCGYGRVDVLVQRRLPPQWQPHSRPCGFVGIRDPTSHMTNVATGRFGSIHSKTELIRGKSVSIEYYVEGIYDIYRY